MNEKQGEMIEKIIKFNKTPCKIQVNCVILYVGV